MRICCALLLVSLLSLNIYGQATTGELVGTVRDPTGAVVPHAAVHARELNTGYTRSVSSNEHGNYVIRALPVGRYEIDFEAQGFKKSVRSDIELNVEASVRVDVTLTVGSNAETVTVTESLPAIDTERGSIESRVLNRQAVDLPLNGRNPLALINLAAGSYYGQSNGYHQIAGNRDVTMNLQVEGQVSQNLVNRGPETMLPIESVAEFVVKTSVAGADSGSGTAQVQVAVKSGANAFHGSLYEFYRGNAMEARNFFNPNNSSAKLVQNQFGFSFGGPIRRDRVFFFAARDEYRSSTFTEGRVSVPTPALRRGDFNGSGSTVLDPFNARRPFPGNVIPADRFNALTLKMLPFLPEANLPGTLNNYYYALPRFGSSPKNALRLDWLLNDQQRIMVLGRLQYNSPPSIIPGVYPEVGTYLSKGSFRSLAVRHDFTITPRLLNQFSAGMLLYDSTSWLKNENRNFLGEFGMQALQPVAPSARGGFPDIRITGYNMLSDLPSIPSVAGSNSFTLTEDLSWVRGNHSAKFGASMLWGSLDRLAVALLRGQLSYGAVHTANAFGDFLLGTPSQVSNDFGGDFGRLRRFYFAGYAMDDWRVTPRLTFNVGLRYEIFTAPIETNNRFSTYDFATKGLIVASSDGKLPEGILPRFLTPAIPIRTSIEAGLPRALTTTDTNNVAPRFSFAWRPFGGNRTVVRGGYGWFFSPVQMERRLNGAVNNPPFLARIFLSTTVNNPVPAEQLVRNLGDMSVGAAPATFGVMGLPPDFRDSLNQQWNFTIERDLGWQTGLRLSYIGNRGTNLPVLLDYNQQYAAPNATGVPTLVRLDPKFSFLYVQSPASGIWYHSLETEVQHRFRGGFGFQANWTWAKMLTEADSDAALPQNSFCLRCDRSDASFQRRHMAKFNVLYDLPFGPGKRWLRVKGPVGLALGGWRVSFIGTMLTGARFTPIYSAVAGDIDLRPGRPNLVGDPNSGDGIHTVTRWFNPAAFTLPRVAPGSFRSLTFGNAARNLVVGPSLQLIDMCLQKQFPVYKEKVRLAVRLEAFNGLNHTNLGSPALDLSFATAGVISSTATPPRQLQVGARLEF